MVFLLAVAVGVGSTACTRSETAESLAESRSAPGDSPSLVLITIDTLRADHLGCYGYQPAKTPNLDRFADSAIRFDLAVTVSNNTLPSHAAMLIGKHPHNFGLPRNGFKLPAEHATLATILKQHGYQTAAFISASALDAQLGLNRGFDEYDQTFDTRELDQVQRRAPATTSRVVEWLSKRNDQPFFLWVHYFDPHYPYTPPAPYDRLFYPDYQGKADGSIEYIAGIAGAPGFPKVEATPDDLRKMVALYDGEIAFLDAALAELFAILDRPRHRNRTLVMVVADHGESLTEHNYYFNHGEFTYQPSMRVPLLIRPPGLASSRAAASVSEQVATIDVFATALAQLRIPVPADTDSRDLTPLFSADTRAAWERRLCFGEGCRPWGIEKATSDSWPNINKCQFVLDYPWKLIVTPYKRAVELFRLDTDPGELHNVADAHADVSRRLQRELARWRERSAAQTPEMVPDNIRKLRALGYSESP